MNSHPFKKTSLGLIFALALSFSVAACGKKDEKGASGLGGTILGDKASGKPGSPFAPLTPPAAGDNGTGTGTPAVEKGTILGSCLSHTERGDICADILGGAAGSELNLESCTQEGGIASNQPCKKDGLTGSCKQSNPGGFGVIFRFYAGFQATDVKEFCAAVHGTIE